MRPHLLRCQAFGAFADEICIDFDGLGAAGLFLLTGDTGSGKTTLLDALGFALYGQVPGERAKAKDLRSHHAADGVKPWVELEFTARNRRFRVRRSPAWQPTNRKTPHQAGGTLEELVDGVAVPVSSRLDEIGNELSRLLGMSFAQFAQVVVLPQGRFADFLQADSSDREALLRKLFHVDRFEEIQKELSRRQQQATAAAAQGRTSLALVAAKVAQASGVEVPERVDGGPVDPARLEAWAQELAADTAVRAARAAETDADAGRAAKAAEAALQAARDLHRRQGARTLAEVELATLLERDEELARDRAAREAARRAEPVRVADGALQERAARLAQADLAVLAAASVPELEAVDLAAPVAEADDDALRTAMARQRETLGRLPELVELQTQVAADEAEATQGAAQSAAATAALQELAQHVSAELTPAAASTQASLARAQAAEREVSDLAHAVTWLEETADLRRQVTAARDGQALAAAAVVPAEETLAVAEKAEHDIRNRRIDAAATELATYLEDGTPCPVCGSLNHPEPAESRPDEATREMERDAAAAVAAARSALAAAQTAAAAAAAHADTLQAAAGTRVPPELVAAKAMLLGVPPTAEAVAASLTVRWRDRKQLAQSVKSLEETLRQAQQRLTEAGQEQVRLEALAESSHTRAAAARDRAERGRARLQTAGFVGESLPDVQARVDAEVAALESLLAARAEVTTARREHERAERLLHETLQSQGFSGLDAARAAMRETMELAELEERITGYDEALAAARARLADPDLAVALEPPVDLDAVQGSQESAAKEAQHAHTELQLCRQRSRELAVLVPELTHTVAELGPLVAHAQLVAELADLAWGKGSNRLKMPLASFVLAARLEEVAAAASRRFSRMSAGRYTLRHTDQGRDGRSRAGLALTVEDNYTGRSRDTATLSGGETFQAALSLALGLADVVTAEAGGSTIDALFVDEGFGSLDADSLDHVMDVLDELRSGGRLVGVVSHVSEMRQRIPAQVRVTKAMTGSSLAVTS